MVSAGPDEIVLTMRPTPLWVNLLEICGVGIFLCFNAAYLVFIWWLARRDNQSIAVGPERTEMISWAIVGICALVIQIFEIVGLARRYRRGPVPRQLAVSADSVRLISAPRWRVRTRRRPLSDVRDVRLKNLKNVIGRPAGAILSVRFIRGPQWQFGFNQKHTAISAEAHRLIRNCVEGGISPPKGQ